VDRLPERRGVHNARDGQPMAFIRHTASWSLTASHEMVEMAIDPWGKRVTPGRSPIHEQGQVQFLVEACDPCQSPEFAYTIDGVLVSDFVTPRFYDPAQTVGARYSFTGHVKGPRKILPGGYVSWRDPQTGVIWQSKWLRDSPEPELVSLGEADFAELTSMRQWVDERSPEASLEQGLAEDDETLIDARQRWQAATQTANAHGEELEKDIARLFGDAQVECEGATMEDESWIIESRGPASFELRGPATADELRRFLEALTDEGFRSRLENEDPYGILEREHGIVVPPGVIPQPPQLPPAEKVLRALEDLEGYDRTRAHIKGLLFATLGGP
jgi:hypothetical protein